MGGEDAGGPESVGAMCKRRTLMADGRYLIYFTFGGEDEAPRAAGDGATARAEEKAGELRSRVTPISFRAGVAG